MSEPPGGRALSHASDLASIRACIAARCLLVPEQATALLAEVDRSSALQEAVNDQPSDRAPDEPQFVDMLEAVHRPQVARLLAEVDAAREALAALRESCIQPTMTRLDDQILPTCLLCGVVGWERSEIVHKLTCALAATRPDEPQGEGR